MTPTPRYSARRRPAPRPPERLRGPERGELPSMPLGEWPTTFRGGAEASPKRPVDGRCHGSRARPLRSCPALWRRRGRLLRPDGDPGRRRRRCRNPMLPQRFLSSTRRRTIRRQRVGVRPARCAARQSARCARHDRSMPHPAPFASRPPDRAGTGTHSPVRTSCTRRAIFDARRSSPYLGSLLHVPRPRGRTSRG